MRASVCCLVATIVVISAGCGGDGDHVMVEVVAGAGVGDVESLVAQAFTDEGDGPLVSRQLAVQGLPDRFLLLPGTQTAGRLIRVHVEALARGTVRAAGDVVVRVPESGTTNTTVTLRPACALVACPRLQSCAPDTGRCDGACSSDSACSSLAGCATESTCEGADPGSGRLGRCAGEGADADGDGFADRRCPFESRSREATDCDDTAADAHPGGLVQCGDARDHDCNGQLDELELCQSACSPDVTVIEVARSSQLDTGREIRAVAGLRVDEDQALVLVAGPQEVTSYGFDLVTEEGERLDSIEVPEVKQLFLVGPLLAAATASGLQLVRVGNEGELQRAGGLIGVPPDDPAPLSAVLVANDTVWVSGEGVGLAAIDITHPDAPRLAGSLEGPAATSLAPLTGTVLATTNDSERKMLLYPAPDRAVPGEPMDFTEAFGLGPQDVVTAMATAPGRSAQDESEIIVLGASVVPSGEPQRRFEIRLYERLGSNNVMQRSVDGDFAVVEGLALDQGTVLLGTQSGAAGAIVRGAERGALSQLKVTEPRGFEGTLQAFWSTTTSLGQPVAAVGLGRVVRVVEFRCTPP